MSVHPADSEIFGSLWATAEMRTLFSDATYLQLMLDVEAALARAEAGLGLVPQKVAEAITKAARLENLRIERIAEGTRETGVPVPALVSELGRAAGEEAARYVHLGATTQDILDSALVLQVRPALEHLRRDLMALARALASRASEYRDTPMAGRTHLQQAVPITFGLKCATWASPLAAHVERLDQVARRSLVVQFGGAAGTLAVARREWNARWPRRSRTSLACARRICPGMSRATPWAKSLRCWDWCAALSPSSRSTWPS